MAIDYLIGNPKLYRRSFLKVVGAGAVLAGCSGDFSLNPGAGIPLTQTEEELGSRTKKIGGVTWDDSVPGQRYFAVNGDRLYENCTEAEKNAFIQRNFPSATKAAGNLDDVVTEYNVEYKQLQKTSTSQAVDLRPPEISWLPALRSDWVLNGSVGFEDFLKFVQAYNKPAVGDYAKFDLNGNEMVDFADFLAFMRDFRKVQSAVPLEISHLLYPAGTIQVKHLLYPNANFESSGAVKTRIEDGYIISDLDASQLMGRDVRVEAVGKDASGEQIFWRECNNKGAVAFL